MPRSEFGWSLCYLSEVSLVVAWLLKCNISRLFLWTSKKIFLKMRNAYFLCSKQTFYIIRMPISYSMAVSLLFSSIHHYIFFLWLQRSIGQPKVIFLQFQKIIIKKRITKKKNLWLPALLLNHFCLLISLEGMPTFIRSWASFQNQIWDVHLYNV